MKEYTFKIASKNMLIGYTSLITSAFCGLILVKNIMNEKKNTTIGLILLIVFFLIPGIKLIRDYYNYCLILTEKSLIERKSKHKKRIVRYSEIKFVSINIAYFQVRIETMQGEKIILNKTLKNIREIIELLKIYLPEERIRII